MRIKIPSGTVQNLEKVFDDLQVAVQSNLSKRLNTLFNSFAIPVDLVNGDVSISDSTLKVFSQPTSGVPTQFLVQPGKAFFSNGNLLNLESNTYFSLPELGITTQADTIYLIKGSFQEVGSNPVSAMNAFLYDTSGETPYSKRNTLYTDSFIPSIKVLVSGDNLNSSLIVDPLNEVPLAIVKTDSTGKLINTSTFTFLDSSSKTWVSDSNGVIDLRSLSSLKISKNVLDENDVILKDRDSTGNFKQQGKVEFGDDILVSDDVFIVNKSEGKVGIKTGTPTSELTIDGNIEFTPSTSRRVYMGGQAEATFGVAYSTDMPDHGIFYTEGSPDIINLSPNGSSVAGVVTVTGDGKVGINKTNPDEALHLEGSIRGDQDGGSIRIQTASGWTNIGSQNSNWTHIQTDRERFYFNKEVVVNTGKISSYDENLVLKADYDNSITDNQLYLKTDGSIGVGYVPSSTDISSLHIKQTSDLWKALTIHNADDTSSISVYTGTSESFIETDSTSNLVIKTGSNDRILVRYLDGHVGINNLSPDEMLHVIGNIKSSDTIYSKDADLSGNLTVNKLGTIQNLTGGFAQLQEVNIVGDGGLSVSGGSASIQTLYNAYGTIENLDVSNSSTINEASIKSLSVPTASGQNFTNMGAGFDRSGNLALGVNKPINTENSRLLVKGDTRFFNDSGSAANFNLGGVATSGGFNFQVNGSDMEVTGPGGHVASFRSLDGVLYSPKILADDIDLVQDPTLSGTRTFGWGYANMSILDIDANEVRTGGASIGQSSEFTGVTTLHDAVIYGLTLGGGDEGSNVYISGVTNEEFYLGLGTDNQRMVATVAGTPTTLTNFRLYDIYPTSNKEEQAGFVSLKWNYDGLSFVAGQAPSVGGNTVKLTHFTMSSNDLLLASGKTLYLEETSNSYEILSIVDNSTDIEVTIRGVFSQSDQDSAATARIVDRHVTDYVLKCIELDLNTSQPTGYVETYMLDSEFVTNPNYIVKLNLGKRWYFELKGKNSYLEGSFERMPAGTYDPDHDGVGYVSYSQNYLHELPDITTAAGISLTSSVFGFNIEIVGSGWYDSTDDQNSAHEFEVVYSKTENPSFSASDTSVTKFITGNKLTPVTTNTPSMWYVKVRPLQNKQPVGTELYSDIVSGGGGIAPGDQILVQMPVNVTVVSGLVTKDVGTGDVTFNAFDKNGDEITMGNGEQTGKDIIIKDSTGSTNKGETKINRHSTTFSA